MKTAAEYLAEVNKYNARLSASSSEEAKLLKRQITQNQRELRQLKKEINADIRDIRTHYRDKMAGAASTTSGVLSIFGKRKLAGQVRADTKRSLRSEQDRLVGSYESVRATIDDMLNQMDRAKLQLDRYLAEG